MTPIEANIPNWVWLEFHSAISERMRQVVHENWTAEHDDAQIDSQLARAAAAYALPDSQREMTYRVCTDCSTANVPEEWPYDWEPSWFKPAQNPLNPVERLRELDKAMALLAAEKGRILRAIEKKSSTNH